MGNEIDLVAGLLALVTGVSISFFAGLWGSETERSE